MIFENNAIILAAGKGTRMNQDAPKCACCVLGKPMIKHLVDTLKEVGIKNIIVVVGYKKEYIIDILKDDEVEFVTQEEQLGTGHACLMAEVKLAGCFGDTLIIPGDMPLVGANNIKKLLEKHQDDNNKMTILSSVFENPFSYGRIIKENNNVCAIVEEKEATDSQKLIKEVNSGLYIVDNKLLFESLHMIDNNNSKNEYYLTDIVKVLSNNHRVGTLCVDYDYRLMGINDVPTLNEVERLALDNK